jgi:phage shock protein A
MSRTSTGFFGRIANLFKGFLSVFAGSAESKHPKLVYQRAIDEKVNRYNELKRVASAVFYQEVKQKRRLEEIKELLQGIEPQITHAVKSGQDEAALLLIQKKNESLEHMNAVRQDWERSCKEAQRLKRSLLDFKSEIEKLKSEKQIMLARRASAMARIEASSHQGVVNDDVSDTALARIREEIDVLVTQADITENISDESGEHVLANLKASFDREACVRELDQLKETLRPKALPSPRKVAAMAVLEQTEVVVN